MIDKDRFREVLGNYPTGVTVITAIDEDGNPAGMAVGSFTSVSLDPPLVAFLPDKSSSSFPKMRTSDTFCVNVLAAEQEHLCRTFAMRGGDKFASVSWSPSPSGAPRIDGVAAWIDCDYESVQEAGDHFLVIGRVRELDSNGERLPLVFFQGGYGKFSPSSLVAVPEADFVSHLRLADLSRAEMERVAARVGTECLAIAPVHEQLVVLASAGTPHGGAQYTRVGQRMPFVPPVGTPFLAWADDETLTSWLAKTGQELTDSDRTEYEKLLAVVRQRGFSLSLGNDKHTELQHAIDRYSQNGDPGSLVRAKRLGAQLAPQSEPTEELEPRESYDVRLISVPVFGPDHSVPLALSLWGIPSPCTGADAYRYLDALRAAADQVSAAITG